jgi:hypothetical protein
MGDRFQADLDKVNRHAEEERMRGLLRLDMPLRDQMAVLAGQDRQIKDFVLPSMRKLGEQLFKMPDEDIQAQLRFALSLSYGEKGAQQIDKMVECFGPEARSWYKRLPTVKYDLTEAGTAFRNQAGLEQLWEWLECISIDPKKPKAPALYVTHVSRKNLQENPGEEGEGVGGEGE